MGYKMPRSRFVQMVEGDCKIWKEYLKKWLRMGLALLLWQAQLAFNLFKQKHRVKNLPGVIH
jgi:peptidyl-tRNA hydrolase